jgi:hypothetical protein
MIGRCVWDAIVTVDGPSVLYFAKTWERRLTVERISYLSFNIADLTGWLSSYSDRNTMGWDEILISK